MGTKDFTDWNGRKRKNALYPPKDKPVHKSHIKEKSVGFKTKVDRFRAALVQLAWMWAYRYHAWEHYHRTGRHCWFYRHHRWSGLNALKKLRKMKTQYTREGIYQDVLEAVGPWKLSERMKRYL